MTERQKKSAAGAYIEKLRIRTPAGHALAMNLSGGNQQKVVIAKWLMRDAEILIFDEPPRGIMWARRKKFFALIFDWRKAERRS